MNTIDGMIRDLESDETIIGGCTTVGEIVIALESLKEQRKKGEWIFTKTIFDGRTVECSSCHKKWIPYEEQRWKEENKFCPNCGNYKGDGL